MSDPSADLFKAIRAALVADATLAGLVGARVFSDWATNADMPLIRMSIPLVEEQNEDCGDASLADVRVHIYTRDGPVARSTLAGRVRAVLDGAALTLDANELRSIDHTQTIHTSDPSDPSVLSAVVRFTAVTIATS